MKRIFNNIVVKFVIITLLFFLFTSPIVVLFGPFPIMRSRHPQYITWLYNKDELNQILGTVTTTDTQKVFSFKLRTDPTLNLKKIETSRFVGYLLEIPNPTRVQVAMAEDINEKGDTTSNIAKKNNAVAAGNYNKKQLSDLGAVEGLTFGPPLIINGEKVIKNGDGGWGISPRSAIGQKKDGTIMFLVIDGRQPGYSIGATLVDAQNMMYENGAYIAANLDGGSSTTLYYNGKVVNKPADLLGERMIPTAFIVK